MSASETSLSETGLSETARPALARGPSLARLLLRRRPAAIGLLVLVVVIVAVAFAPWIASVSPNRLSIVNRLRPPSSRFLFGTDEFGHDVFARVLYGGRLSLMVGASVVAISTVAGLTLGLIGGYFRRLDAPVSRLLDAMMAFPDILLAISLVAALGPSLANVIAALSIVYTPRLARIVRASTQVIREMSYIEAARASGASTPRILRRHVLRGLLSPILVQGTFVFAYAMLTEAGLSFLGVGASPDIPTWGTMISLGREYMDTAPWIILFPGLAITVTVLALQLVGDAMRDLLDPKLSREV